MSTTFILHGGLTSVESPSNALFFKEVTSKLSDGDVVLFVGFAREDDKIESIFVRDKLSLVASTDKNISVINASHESFLEEVRSANVIYLTGGDTRKLLKELQLHSEFLSLLGGKTIVGSSAGANVFAKYYYSVSLQSVCEGLGVLPFSLVCHYDETNAIANEQIVAELRQSAGVTKIVTLAEQAFKVFQMPTNE